MKKAANVTNASQYSSLHVGYEVLMMYRFTVTREVIYYNSPPFILVGCSLEYLTSSMSKV